MYITYNLKPLSRLGSRRDAARVGVSRRKAMFGGHIGVVHSDGATTRGGPICPRGERSGTLGRGAGHNQHQDIQENQFWSVECFGFIINH